MKKGLAYVLCLLFGGSIGPPLVGFGGERETARSRTTVTAGGWGGEGLKASGPGHVAGHLRARRSLCGLFGLGSSLFGLGLG